MQRLKSQTGMLCPPSPTPLTKNSSKISRMEDQTAPPPRVDPDNESRGIEKKPPSPTETTPPSSATRGKYTKKLKELVKQRRHGHYTGKKYDLLQATHRYNIKAQVMIVDPTAQHVLLLGTNLHGSHQANVFIDPTIGASLEYRHLIKGTTKAIRENSFANEIV